MAPKGANEQGPAKRKAEVKMHQMSFSELLLNSSVRSEDELGLGRQQVAIWRLFCKVEDDRVRYEQVWTRQLRHAAAQYQARLSELRKWLIEYGLTIDCTGRGVAGDNRYEIVPLQGSRYEKRLKLRGRL